MRMRIWQYNLSIVGQQNIIMPKGAELLSVSVQHGLPALWARVDETAGMVPRAIVLIETGRRGNEGQKKLQFIGTVLLDDGDYVAHFFDGGEL